MWALKIWTHGHEEDAIYEQYSDEDLLRAEYQNAERDGLCAEIYERCHSQEFACRLPENMSRQEADLLYDRTR